MADESRDMVTAERVPSGRHVLLELFKASLDQARLLPRIIIAAKAVSKIGTYFEACICVPRRPARAASCGDYDTVVGYERNVETRSGLLHVVFKYTMK